jgi:cytoskeletal protein CcmA (bactofilin family)
MVFKTKRSVLQAEQGFGDLHDGAPPGGMKAPTIITAEMSVHGDLQSHGDIQIEGRVVGQIKVNRLILADGASVTGDIFAKEVRICGTLKGSVHGEMVTVAETGRIIGDIFHELLSIQTGGQWEGSCHRLSASEAPPSAATPKAPNATEADITENATSAEQMPRIYANGHDRQAAA